MHRNPKALPTGVRAVHTRPCSSRREGKCDCEPSFRAWVYDQRSKTKIEKTFSGHGSRAAAIAWREDARGQQRRGQLAVPSKRTLREAAEAWLEAAKTDPPTILNRSGQRYKPSVLRVYEGDLRTYVLPDLGAKRLPDVRRGDLQALVDRLLGRGLSDSKVRNVIVAVRVLYRHAVERDEVFANPTTGVRLPKGLGQRERAVDAAEAADLLAVLPSSVRPIYATAFYAGLRRGELRGLRFEDVDLAAGEIRVERGWDDYEGAIEPKSAKGTRKVPITALLRDHLAELKASSGRDGSDLVFGATAERPFTPSHIRKQAAVAWAAANEERVDQGLRPLVPIGLHECRHTFVSLMADAGLSLERIGDYVGHSSTYMTDRYRHLLPGHEDETRRVVDEYFARADSQARIDQLEGERS